jgi:2-keto-4-pentenoate hydratase/2-oxohepta-3-ene-1,7-dioic acid hydratase in catechol pathway
MTARDLQMSDGQWTRAKNFDTFCPLGPWVETELDPGGLDLSLELNGTVKQRSNTSRLIAGVPRLVSFISSIMTLCPGDVIMTGTPSGVGPVERGDEIEMSIEGIGTLTCKIG